jgi:type IV pilus assembly protein PilV
MPASLSPIRRATQGGFSLIEIMVAVFVLSIGLLGMAALMATSLRNNQSADHRSQAVNLAYDAIEMIRSNKSNALQYSRAYSNPAAHCAGDEETFTYGSGELYSQDRNYWGRKLCRTLPNGSGRIAVANSITTGYAVTVDVCWSDNRAATDQGAACPALAADQFGACSADGATCVIRIVSGV